MSKFLIEVQHEGNAFSCAHAIETFLQTGSHFLTHADWGCKDGEHKAWMVVEVINKEAAKSIVPPMFRSNTKVVQLNTFSIKDVENMHNH